MLYTVQSHWFIEAYCAIVFSGDAMRFVDIDTLKEGMEICKTIYGKNGEVMLRKGTVVKTPFIKRLAALGYPGVYITDSFSQELVVEEIISEELRQKATFTIKKVFTEIETAGPSLKNARANAEKVKAIVNEVLAQILKSDITLVNIRDLKNFDDYTYYHSVNVAVLSLVIGRSLGLKEAQLQELGMSAILHDLGKIFIGSEIINKPDLLTAEEFEKVKHHSLEGYKYLKDDFNVSSKIYVSILQHHENYDGNGYPNGAKKDDIFLYARIISVADVYDALTSERPYKKALNPHEALEFIMQNEGKKFDPAIIRVVADHFAPFPVGTFVRLSNDMVGIVMENFTNTCLKPKVKVFWKGDKPIAPEIINLRDDAAYAYVGVVKSLTGL